MSDPVASELASGPDGDDECAAVLARVWLYLDDECNPEQRDELREHLESCSPCLARYGIEEQLKTLLARKCGGEHAPHAFRERLRDSIRGVVLSQTDVTVSRTPGRTAVDVRSTIIEFDD
jgi:mycothiol system anti-sigma-R factor